MATVARSYILYSSKIRPLGRCFTTTSVLTAGHSKWSTIKYDKAKEDVGSSASTDRPSADITTGRKGQAAFCYHPPNSLNLETYVHSRNETWQDLSLMPQPVYGPDPASNPQLAAVVATAKKQGVPKATIENAIARGQGISPKGAALENLTIEAMIPPSVAIIIECQTDSKLKTLSDIRLLIKDSDGSVTPTTHFFQRRGRLVFEKAKGLSETEIFDQAIEAHATDVQVEEDGNVVVYTEPNQTAATAQTLSNNLGLKVQSSGLVWDPKEETKVEMETTEALDAFLDRIQDDPAVQGIYLNASKL